jgi:hypothetical protein
MSVIYGGGSVSQNRRVSSRDREPERPDRRAIIAGAAAALAGSLPVLRLLATGDQAHAVPGLQLFDSQAARALGERYLEIEPAERNASTLLRHLFGDTLTSATDRRAVARLRACLRRHRQRDFERGDLVLLEGWFLARSEARLLALTALLPAR